MVESGSGIGFLFWGGGGGEFDGHIWCGRGHFGSDEWNILLNQECKRDISLKQLGNGKLESHNTPPSYVKHSHIATS